MNKRTVSIKPEAYLAAIQWMMEGNHDRAPAAISLQICHRFNISVSDLSYAVKYWENLQTKWDRGLLEQCKIARRVKGEPLTPEEIQGIAKAIEEMEKTDATNEQNTSAEPVESS